MAGSFRQKRHQLVGFWLICLGAWFMSHDRG